MVSKTLLLLLCLCLPLHAVDYTLPAVNQGAWLPGTNVGVVGGIDQYRVSGASARPGANDTLNAVTGYSADPTGVADSTTAIANAIAAATAGDIVYLPTGTYKTTSQIGIPSNITLRGDGSTLSHVVYTGTGTVFDIGSSYEFTGAAQTLTGTKTKGTSVLTVSSSTGFVAGYLVKVFIANETDNTRIQAGAAPRFSVSGYEEVLAYVATVTAVGSGTITIDPPLPTDCTNAATRIVALNNPSYRAEKVGIEGISIDGLTGPAARAISMRLGVECWIYDVAIANIANYPVAFDNCYRCEMRYSSAGDRVASGSNGSGILMNNSTSMLVEDNHVYNFSPLTEENFGSVNNAWLYNLFREPVGNCLIVNHGAHNMLNLYEGNVAQGYKSDGYYGTASNITFFRNWFHGSDDTGANLAAAAIQNRFTRQFAHVGNVFGWDGHANGNEVYGNPNIGNGSYTGTAQPTSGDFWTDWGITATLTTRTSDTVGVFTFSSIGGYYDGLGGASERGPAIIWSGGARYNMEVTNVSGLLVTMENSANGSTTGSILPTAGTSITGVWGGAAVFQELDLDCEASTYKTHNYNSVVSGTGAVDNSTVDVLPSSLAYSAKPSYFGSLTWPPVNPDGPTFSIEIIPAGYRFVHDAAPGGGGSGTGSLTTTTLNVTTLRIAP